MPAACATCGKPVEKQLNNTVSTYLPPKSSEGLRLAWTEAGRNGHNSSLETFVTESRFSFQSCVNPIRDGAAAFMQLHVVPENILVRFLFRFSFHSVLSGFIDNR